MKMKVVVYGEKVEVSFKIPIPGSSDDTLSPLKSREDIRAIRKE
jgi:hypothetical protein